VDIVLAERAILAEKRWEAWEDENVFFLGFTRQEEDAKTGYGMRPATAEFASMVTVDWFDSVNFFLGVSTALTT
jgi:hypothetical protein